MNFNPSDNTSNQIIQNKNMNFAFLHKNKSAVVGFVGVIEPEVTEKFCEKSTGSFKRNYLNKKSDNWPNMVNLTIVILILAIVSIEENQKNIYLTLTGLF